MKQLISASLFLGIVAYLTFMAQGCGHPKGPQLVYPDTTITAIRYAERMDSVAYVKARDERAYRVISEVNKDVATDSSNGRKIYETRKSLDTSYIVWHSMYTDSIGRELQPDSSARFSKRSATWIVVNPLMILQDYNKDFNPASHRYKKY